ncbi:MAG TPA: hypothetical protein PK797_15320, partial [Burkholderiaceae bacterium]|nr:hypothetical protein [Burkholderiaceae bacterium]
MTPTPCPRPTDACPEATRRATDLNPLPARQGHGRGALLGALMAAVLLAACGGGGSEESTSPTPSPSPSPAGACGTMTALTTADLAPFAGSYAIKHFDSGTGTEVGSGNLTLSG